MKYFKSLLLSGVAVLSTLSAVSGQTRIHDLQFVRHHNVALSNADADRISADATMVLQIDDGANDIACDVLFRRRGNVSSFSNSDGIIDTVDEFLHIEQIAGDVKVVRAINWCGSTGAGIIGCARVPGSSLSMVRFTPSLEGILMAHEFGHNQGLSHRNGADNLMHPSIGSTRRGVNQGECNAFRNPASLQAIQVSSKIAAQNAAPVDTLAAIKQHYLHGFPVSVGLSLSKKDAELIVELLNNEKAKEWWPNGLAAIALMGADVSFKAITAFIERQDNEELKDPEKFRALATAPIALGYLVNVTGDKDVLAYIVNAAAPHRLLENKQFEAVLSPKKEIAREEAVAISGSFIAALGLAVTDDDAALKALSALKGENTVFQSLVDSGVDQAIFEYNRTKEMGLEAYRDHK